MGSNPLIGIPGAGILVNVLDSVPVLGALLGQGYRPPQWSYGPQLWKMTVPQPQAASASTSISFDGQTVPVQGSGSPQIKFSYIDYFFDAVLRTDHSSPLVVTKHPVQNGAAISDHSYLLPARIVLDIGMSDALDSFVQGQYGGYDSKSRGAYITFQAIKAARLPLTLTTRLSVYQNMMLTDVRAHEDIRTRFGLRASLIFEQVFFGTVTTQPIQSDRPDQSQSSNPGVSAPVSVPQSLQGFYDSSSNQWDSNIPA